MRKKIKKTQSSNSIPATNTKELKEIPLFRLRQMAEIIELKKELTNN